MGWIFAVCEWYTWLPQGWDAAHLQSRDCIIKIILWWENITNDQSSDLHSWVYKQSGTTWADVDKDKMHYPHTLVGALDLLGRLSIFDDIMTWGIHSRILTTIFHLWTALRRIWCSTKKSNHCWLHNECHLNWSTTAKGRPISLCNLIGNMLDSMNGKLSQDEAYCAMLDVSSDL